jgi:folate-dependent phosphoribosylglycinamide formyltransferase PurN
MAQQHRVGRTVLICHDDEPLNRECLARWMASFTDLAAVVVIAEPQARFRQRIKREISRVGWLRFLDVMAFRLYYRFALQDRDTRTLDSLAESLNRRYPALPASVRILNTASPNSPETEALLKEAAPDIIIARCKNILNKRIFGQARVGTFVMHPGVCPQYRNAHGCFWALASGDVDNVGMTLLKVDAGVDTGPVYGYYTYDYDELNESHAIIQARVVFDNLDALEQKFRRILAGNADTVDTTGKPSRAWGQPWLTAWMRWKSEAKRRRRRAAATTA